MSETIFIGVAWPYANGPLHLGHIAGAYLPSDIFARYHRLKGNRVLMVSGSDQHGTPITIRAEQEHTTPAQVADKYHQGYLECWQKLGISFDLYTSTGTENHKQVVQEIFLSLLHKDYIYRAVVSQLFCPKCQRFLPDRYIEGTCPLCGAPGARGDQCDACGRPLNSIELMEARCRLCGSEPVIEESEHFFLRLSAFRDSLLDWVRLKTHWRPNVLNFTMRYLEEGLKDRAITRDIEWGVPVPVAGFENKRIYVWFDAVIGYLSASKEWSKTTGNEDAWKEFWHGDARGVYFIGKDNIPFHTIVWPAMLMGYNHNLNLPDNVPANEFLTINGKKLSTSHNWAVWLPDYLSRYDPDPLRYFLSVNMPETGDADFSWPEFIRRNNDEQVATYGNLAHRVLTFTYRNFDGRVPEAGELDAQSEALIQKAYETLQTMDKLLSQCHFKESIKLAMSLAQEANRYLDDKSPWKIIKKDKGAAGTALYTAIAILSCLKTALYPFLPFSSSKLHSLLGFEGNITDLGWQVHLPVAGQKLLSPEPLFTKLDEAIAEEETGRLGQPT